jgi:hypothetical protein
MSTECMKTYRILKILTSIWLEKPSKRVPRMPQFWGPFLVQKWSKKCKILDPLFGSVLGSSGLRFGPQNGIQKSIKRDPKMEQVFERSGRLLGTVLEAFLAVLGLSWEARCARIPAKNISKRTFSKSLLFAMIALLDRFWKPSWSLLGRFGLKNGHQIR